ncbi:MAG: hypothetical protein KKH08_00730, partial [Candidatus Omnitrophica bacterium]|nr:hypothetical protein [Candidatus Omnitrophota bacterium]
MEKKLLLAVTLSIIVMLVYPLFIARISPPTNPEIYIQPIEQQEVTDTPARVSETVREDNLAPAELNLVSLETDRYEMGITGLGGSINSVKIKNGDRFDTDLVDGAIYDAGLFAIE